MSITPNVNNFVNTLQTSGVNQKLINYLKPEEASIVVYALNKAIRRIPGLLTNFYNVNKAILTTAKIQSPIKGPAERARFQSKFPLEYRLECRKSWVKLSQKIRKKDSIKGALLAGGAALAMYTTFPIASEKISLLPIQVAAAIGMPAYLLDKFKKVAPIAVGGAVGALAGNVFIALGESLGVFGEGAKEDMAIVGHFSIIGATVGGLLANRMYGIHQRRFWGQPINSSC